MKKGVLFILMLGCVLAVQAQNDTIKNWTIKGKASLNVNQNYYSNWAAGGENNFGIIGKYTMNADYAKGKNAWLNWLDTGLGYSVIGKSGPTKTDDKIELLSTYKRKLTKVWALTAVGSLKTQFAKGYNYAVDSSTPISRFMAPGYIDLGVGVMYEPVNWFSVNFSPSNVRWTIVNDQRLADAGAFGLDPAVRDLDGNMLQHARKSRLGFGARLILILKYEVVKNVNLSTKLDLFSDYLDKPQNIVVDWQVLAGLKVNDWLNVNISTQLLYDDRVMITDKNGNTGPRTQFKQLLMLGVGYSF
jgi:hypothetical protein